MDTAVGPVADGQPAWTVDYPDEPIWTVTYDGGVVTGTLPTPGTISVWLPGTGEVDLSEVVAADPERPPLVRAAKAAAEHVRLFMRPNSWMGDDDEQLIVVLALRLLTQSKESWPYFDSCGPDHQFYIAITVDQIGLDVAVLERLFGARSVPARSAAQLAPLMVQDRNAQTLIRIWVEKVRYPGAWLDDGPSDGELVSQLKAYSERERTLLVEYLGELVREPSWLSAGMVSDVVTAWERVTETDRVRLGLRHRLGIHPVR